MNFTISSQMSQKLAKETEKVTTISGKYYVAMSGKTREISIE